MSDTQVRVQIDGTHAAITLFTESGLNVFSTDVLHRFGEAVAQVARESAVRTAAIEAEGKVFVAGADIKAMGGFTPEDAKAYGALGQQVLNDLAALPCITVAVINGAALGGGLELALACDFRIAVKSAKIGLPETSLGVIPGWNGIPRLVNLIGPARAKRMFLSAQPIVAEQGVAMGLIDEVVDISEALPSAVQAFCKSFQRGAPAAVALAKRAMRDGDDLTAFADCFKAADRTEGIAAFIEKRSAWWME